MQRYELSVYAKFNFDGTIVPCSLTLPDGRSFAIDRVLDVRPAASRKVGGCGIRYLCRISGRQVALFLEDTHWFFEPCGA